MKNQRLRLACQLYDETVARASSEDRPALEEKVRTLTLLGIGELLEQLVADPSGHQRWTPSKLGDRVVWRGRRGTMEGVPDFIGLAGPLPPFPAGVRLDEEDFVRVVSASELFAAEGEGPAVEDSGQLITVSVQDLFEGERQLREEDGGGGTPVLDLKPR